MSMCAVHMEKMKMSALGGIQSHNRREHESKKNKEIDYSKSVHNHEFILEDDTSYHQAVKERIAMLNLKRAVRKDAVVYCSFIVSSDSSFFYRLGSDIHPQREERESVRLGIEPPTPFEYTSKAYQEECIREGALHFFKKTVDFFADRYGLENLVNATVHFDEATPHLHIGLVPVTEDGRLSAKSIFTPVELKQLQTEYAENVGALFGLERGKEGSEVQHLDEVTYKLNQRQAQVKGLDETVSRLIEEQDKLELSVSDKEKQAVATEERLSEAQEKLSEIQNAWQEVEQLRGEMMSKVEALESAKADYEQATAQFDKKINQAIEERQDLLYHIVKFCDKIQVNIGGVVRSVWEHFKKADNKPRSIDLIKEVYDLESRLQKEKTPQKDYQRENNTQSRIK